MKRFITLILLTAGVIHFASGSSYSQEREKRAQTGLKFLSVSNDAKLSGLADASTAIYAGSNSIFYNPSTLSQMRGTFDVSFGQTQWIADINYLSGSAAFRPFDGAFGVFAVSVVFVDYGEFKRTVVASNEQGFLDVGTFNPYSTAIGIGYAKELSEKFSIGGGIRYVSQDLGGQYLDYQTGENNTTEQFNVDAPSFDFGILYRTGFKSLDFGMSVRNFSTEVTYVDEGFQLPLTFRIGFSMNLMDLTNFNPEMHKFNLAVDAVNPRDYDEQLAVGGEYVFMNSFALRAGYVFPTDEAGFSGGLGIQQDFAGMHFELNYAYTSFGVFDDVHRFSFNYSF